MILFTGTASLVAAATTAITALIGGIGGFFSVKKALAWHTAEPNEMGAKKKDFWMTFFISVVAVCAPSIITWILGFYGV